jgi:hypothetical protein
MALEVSPPPAPNPFLGRAHDENFPGLHEVFGAGPPGAPPVPLSSDAAAPSPTGGALPHERSGARQRARAHQSPSAAAAASHSQHLEQEDVASADFVDAERVLGDLSNNLEDSIDMQLMKAEVLPDFHLGDTPVNVRRGPEETPTTYKARKQLEAHELAAAQLEDERYFGTRQPGPGSTPKKAAPILFDPKTAGPTPQQPPRSADSQRSGPHSGRRGGTWPSASSPLWNPSPASIPEHPEASPFGSSNGDFGRGVTGGLEDAETQTDVMIAPDLLCQLVPCTPSGEAVTPSGYSAGSGATPVGLGDKLASHRRHVTTPLPGPQQQQDQQDRRQSPARPLSPVTVATAVRNYEDFHRIPRGTATLDQVAGSSAGVIGWTRYEGRLDEGPQQIGSAPPVQEPPHSGAQHEDPFPASISPMAASGTPVERSGETVPSQVEHVMTVSALTVPELTCSIDTECMLFCRDSRAFQEYTRLAFSRLVIGVFATHLSPAAATAPTQVCRL